MKNEFPLLKHQLPWKLITANNQQSERITKHRTTEILHITTFNVAGTSPAHRTVRTATLRNRSR